LNLNDLKGKQIGKKSNRHQMPADRFQCPALSTIANEIDDLLHQVTLLVASQ